MVYGRYGIRMPTFFSDIISHLILLLSWLSKTKSYGTLRPQALHQMDPATRKFSYISKKIQNRIAYSSFFIGSLFQIPRQARFWLLTWIRLRRRITSSFLMSLHRNSPTSFRFGTSWPFKFRNRLQQSKR